MADTKLSALTALAVEPADADEIYVNDGGVSKRITYGVFKAALLARANHTGTQLAATISDFATAVGADSAVAANTAKVTNATHSGDASGDTALTLQAAAISGKSTATAASGDYILVLDTSDSPNALKKALISDIHPTEFIAIAASDETTALTTGTAKATFRMPYAFTLTEVRGSVTTAPTDASLIVDINKKVGTPSPDVPTSILSTLLYIDSGEFSSQDASSSPEHQAVIGTASLEDDCEITIDIDQVGSTVAGAGLKVYLIGYRT